MMLLLLQTLLIAVICAVFYGLGYFVGFALGTGYTHPVVKEANRRFSRAFTGKVGAVSRPTAKELKEREEPHIKAEKDAMSSLLHDILPMKKN